jgi:hypothetical protein
MPVSQSGGQTRGGRCASCGRPASVTFVVEDDWGSRSSQAFCLECAEKRPPMRSHAGRALLAAAAPRWLIRIGAAIALLALSADYLGIAGKQGFGWRQLAGGEVGTLVLIVGVLLRSGVTTLVGLVLMALSLGADLLRVGHSPGIGWRQQLALPIAALSVAAGLLWRRLQRPRAKTPERLRAAPAGPTDSSDAASTSSRGETLH